MARQTTNPFPVEEALAYIEGDCAPYTVGYLGLTMGEVVELDTHIPAENGRWGVHAAQVLPRAQVRSIATARKALIKAGGFVASPARKGETVDSPALLGLRPSRFLAADGSGRVLFVSREVSGLEREARADQAARERSARYAAPETEEV